MPLHERLPHEKPEPQYDKPPHEEIIEVLERKFREINERLDEIEARIGR